MRNGVLIFLSLLGGCGDRVSKVFTNTDADVVDAGDVPDLADVGDLAKSAGVGWISVTSESGGQAVHWTFYATFGAGESPPVNTVGCQAASLTTNVSLQHPVGAGVLTLQPDGTQVTFDGQGYTSSPQYGGNPWTSVSGSGGVVPAFQMPLSKTQVDIQFADPGTTIDRSHDFVVTWTSTSTGTLDLGLFPDGGASGLLCSFPLTAGKGVVPKALLQGFTAGTTGTLSGYANHFDQLQVDGWLLLQSRSMSVFREFHGDPTGHAVTFR